MNGRSHTLERRGSSTVKKCRLCSQMYCRNVENGKRIGRMGGFQEFFKYQTTF